MRRLLITGASGLLGRHVAAQALAQGWDVVGTYHTAPLDLPIHWRPLELADPGAVAAVVEAAEPHAVVHTACRMTPPGLWEATAEGSAAVASAARRGGARLVHISTDALLDGTGSPYDEQARPAPLHLYGAAKAAAETAVAAVDRGAAIVRTSLIISRADPLDAQTRLALDIAAGRRAERLFTDEYRCPVGVEDLAAAVLELAALSFAGLINVTGPDAVSRHELGCLVLRARGLDAAGLPAATVAGSGLRRPADLRLDLTLARSVLRTRVRGIREYLAPPPSPAR